MKDTSRSVLVVPCYNEARRLPAGEFTAFCADCRFDGIDIVFVDDGSRDNTLAVLESLRQRLPDRVTVLAGGVNRGKAEAVRLGMRKALEGPWKYAGYWDADLATPLWTSAQFIAILDSRPEIDMVFGARVKLLGRRVERKAARHYLGRVFATVVSVMLQLPIYDTQCGAKMFRNTPEAAALFDQPFLSRWVFDVEIIARHIRRLGSPAATESRIYEYPLEQWVDIGGSKVKPTDFLVALRDILRIRRRYFGG